MVKEYEKLEKENSKKEKVVVKGKFSPISLDKEKKKIEEKRVEGELEEKIEELDGELDLQDFSQFVSGGNIVEIAPGAAKVLASNEKPIENLEEEFGGFESGEKKKDDEDIVKYGVGQDKLYQQSDDARAYQESMRSGENPVFNGRLQFFSDSGQNVSLFSNVRPKINVEIPDEMRASENPEEKMFGVKRDYLSVTDEENKTGADRFSNRKYRIK